MVTGFINHTDQHRFVEAVQMLAVDGLLTVGCESFRLVSDTILHGTQIICPLQMHGLL